jgi:hypothetical protein
MRFPSLFAFLLAIFLFFPAPSTAQAPVQAEWTLMLYMDADNDLEAPQMQDLMEMAGVGSTATVNIIVLADRHVDGEDRGYTNGDVGGIKNWTTAKLLIVEKGRLRELADKGELNMGDPENLVRFVEEVSKNLPAKRYGLVFGDHGSGWPGILGDEANKDSLTMAELGSALARATKSTGKLELIGFDACLMANFEVMRTVAPYAKAMVASEELEPGDGWNYRPAFARLVANPTLDGFAVGRIIVDTYRDYYIKDQGNRDSSITLSLTDLSKIDALSSAVNDLSMHKQAFIKAGGRPNILKVAGARWRTEDYGQEEGGKSAAEFFDLVHYAQNVKAASNDPNVAKAADAVIAATKSAVLHKANGSARPNSNGISIYFPNKAKSVIDSGYAKAPFAANLRWSGLLMDYTGIVTADTSKPQLTPATTNTQNLAANAVATVTSSVKGDDIAEATFVLAESDGESALIIGAVPTEPDEKGVLREEWDGTWFAITDGKNELICPITDFSELEDEKDIYYAEVPGQVQFKGRREWIDITMYFVLDFSEDEVTGEFVYAFRERNGQLREVDINVGDLVRPVYLMVDADGEVEEVAHTDPADILRVTVDDGLAIGMTEVAAGDYLLGFLVTDYSGNESEEFVEITRK